MSGLQTQVRLSGLPAGTYRVDVRAVNGFGRGPAASTEALSVSGAPQTYAAAITNSRPNLYWRFGDRSGTRVADASGAARDGQYVLDNFVNEGVDLNVPAR